MKKKPVTLVISDTHFGGQTALAPPEWRLDTGEITNGKPVYQKIIASEAQMWLHDCWQDLLQYVFSLMKAHKADLKVIHLGDIIDGNHHHSVQVIPNPFDQAEMAVHMLQPLADRAVDMLFIRGTSAHAGEAAEAEAEIAARLGGRSEWGGLYNVDGLYLYLFHHGRVGRRLYSSAAASVAAEATLDCVTAGLPIPRYVLYGHNHMVDDSGEKNPITRAIALPSWQLRTEYAYRIAPGVRSDIGAVIILPDGSLDLSRLRYRARNEVKNF